MRSLGKQVRIRFISAVPEYVLNQLMDIGVTVLDVRREDLLTTVITIRSSHLKKAKIELKRVQAEVSSFRKIGFLWFPGKLARHPVLILGMVVFALMLLLVRERIFFVRVSGNHLLPTNLILAEAEESGICFGQKAKYVRSEEVKNQMLAQLPELQWVGITTSGCIATIHIQERNTPEKTDTFPGPVSHIVASQDGTVTMLTVQQGSPLVSVGEAVKKGDVLVSGYTDLGLKIKAENAQAEIMAYTTRRNVFITPSPSYARKALFKKHRSYRIQIGKKVINFCNHSGIQEGVCVKMYSEDYWTLPGGFCLPVSVKRIDCLHYSVSDQIQDFSEAEKWLSEYAAKYLQRQMVSGQILDENLKWHKSDRFYQLDSLYACHEMIGQVKYEEITEQNAEDY